MSGIREKIDNCDKDMGDRSPKDYIFMMSVSELVELRNIIESLEADNEQLKKDADAYKLYISEQEAEKELLTAKVKELEFAVSTRDVKIRSLESDNALLTKALTDIDSINWGADGDCGAQRIVNEVLD